jgi:hypothetical protein
MFLKPAEINFIKQRTWQSKEPKHMKILAGVFLRLFKVHARSHLESLWIQPVDEKDWVCSDPILVVKLDVDRV